MYFRSKILSPSNNSLIPPKTPHKNAHYAQKFALRQTICLFRPKVGVIKLIPLKSLPPSSYANTAETIRSLRETARKTERGHEIDREIPRETGRETGRYRKIIY